MKIFVRLFKKIKARIFYARMEKAVIPCPLCKSPDSEHVQLIKHDRYSMGLSTVICRNCNMIFTNPRPTEEALKAFYQNNYRDYYFSYPDPKSDGFKDSFIHLNAQRRAKDIYKRISKYVRENPTVLDVGCGEGALLEQIRGAYPDAHLVGCEPSEKYAVYAAETSCAEVYAIDVDGFLEKNDKTFDLISISHVLEHVTDPIGILKKLSDVLNPDGVIYIEVPNILSSSWHGPGMFHIAHITHFSPNTLINALERTKLDLVEGFFGEHDVEKYAMSVVVKSNHNSKKLISVQGGNDNFQKVCDFVKIRAKKPNIIKRVANLVFKKN